MIEHTRNDPDGAGNAEPTRHSISLQQKKPQVHSCISNKTPAISKNINFVSYRSVIVSTSYMCMWCRIWRIVMLDFHNYVDFRHRFSYFEGWGNSASTEISSIMSFYEFPLGIKISSHTKNDGACDEIVLYCLMQTYSFVHYCAITDALYSFLYICSSFPCPLYYHILQLLRYACFWPLPVVYLPPYVYWYIISSGITQSLASASSFL